MKYEYWRAEKQEVHKKTNQIVGIQLIDRSDFVFHARKILFKYIRR